MNKIMKSINKSEDLDRRLSTGNMEVDSQYILLKTLVLSSVIFSGTIISISLILLNNFLN